MTGRSWISRSGCRAAAAIAALAVAAIAPSGASATALGCFIDQSRIDSLRAEGTTCSGGGTACRGALKNAILGLPNYDTQNFDSGLAADEYGQLVLVWIAKYVANNDTASLTKAY